MPENVPPFLHGNAPASPLLTAQEAAVLCHYSLRHWRRLIQEGKTPAPVSISPRKKFWRKSELLQWIEVGMPERMHWERIRNFGMKGGK